MPRVSVILSAWNAEAHLGAAVASVLSQSAGDLELVLIDDASGDATAAMIRDWAARDRRVAPIFNAENLGLTRSLNLGLAAARGAFAARIDADDLWDREHLAAHLAAFGREPELVLLGCAERGCDAGGRVRSIGRGAAGPAVFRWMSYFSPPIVHSSAMFRMAPVRERGEAYDEGMAAAQDMEFWQRLQDHGPARRLGTPRVTIRLHPASISRRRAGLQADCAHRGCVARLLRDFPGSPAADLRALGDVVFGRMPAGGPEAVPGAVQTLLALLEDHARRSGAGRGARRQMRQHAAATLSIGALRARRNSETALASRLAWSMHRCWSDLLAESGGVLWRRLATLGAWPAGR